MSDLSDLIARLEQVEKPSEELDAQVVAYLSDAVVKRYPPTDDFGPRNKWQFWSKDEKHFLGSESKFPVPLYTSSIGAALSLKERLLPDWLKDAYSREDYEEVIVFNRTRTKSGYSKHQSPAIALLIAILRAYEAEHVS